VTPITPAAVALTADANSFVGLVIVFSPHSAAFRSNCHHYDKTFLMRCYWPT